jgi:hypothetical protein
MELRTVLRPCSVNPEPNGSAEEDQPRSVPSHAPSPLKGVLHAINILLGVNVTDA